MKCPECGLKAACLDTRKRERTPGVYRRYECPHGHRFSTLERLVNQPKETA